MNLINEIEILVVVVICSGVLFASPIDSLTTAKDSTSKKGDILGFPFIYYAPETGWATGGRIGYYWKKTPSNTYTNIFISQDRQFELFFGGENYNGKWKIIPKLKGSQWVDYYYGNKNAAIAKQLYNEKFFWGFLSAQRRIDDLFVGLEFETRAEKVTDSIPGNPSGSGRWYTGGIGTRITYDSRDNVYYPSRGQFCESSLRGFIPLPDALSYSRCIIDYRYFVDFVENATIALQVKTDLTWGAVPFQVQPSVGDLVRGYDKSRYRDTKVIYGQIETRILIYKRISGVIFGGGGDSFSSIGNLGIATLKVAGGGGLRYRLTKNKVNLRFDVAVNREKEMFMYLDIGEAI